MISHMTIKEPLTIGTYIQGGHYVGLYRHNDLIHALIVARIEGEFYNQWHPEYIEIPNCSSDIDGYANTKAMAAAGSQLAIDVLNLKLRGFNDWFIPAKDQLEMCYRYLKPTTRENWVLKDNGINNNSVNNNSVPVGKAYTKTNPSQTQVLDFMKGKSPDAFKESWYWSSTQHSAHYAMGQGFGDGSQNYNSKDGKTYVRAVRSFQL